MKPIYKTKIGKAFSAFLCLAVLFSISFGSPISNAQTTVAFQYTRDLTLGSTGADVVALETALEGKGFLVIPFGVAKGYFGPLTKAALARYQASVGIYPAVGYFGPITRAHFNAIIVVPVVPGCPHGAVFSFLTGAPCVPTTIPGCPLGAIFNIYTGARCPSTPTISPTPDDELEGGAGSLSDVDYISNLSNEEVGEGSDDVEIAGLEIEVDDTSDIEITAVNLNFTEGTADRDFDRYAEEVSIMLDGEEFDRVEADMFEDDDNFDRTISLDSGAIIRSGDIGELTVAVTGATNIDSNDEGETWTLEFESLRFRDAQDAVITDSSTGVLNDGTGRTFSFESFASAADTELNVSLGDDEINDARTIAVDADNDTDNEDLLSFEVEAEGNSDINIDDMSVDFTSVGAGVGEIINTVKLVVDGDVIGSETVSSNNDTSRTITFDSLEWTIGAGETVEVLVRADINDLGGGFTEGDTLVTDVNPDDAAWEVEDEQGNDLSSADKTGSATSDAHAFYATGLDVSLVSTDTDEVSIDGNDNDYVNLTIKFDVTAFGDDVWIPNEATFVSASANSTGGEPTTAQGVGYHLQYTSPGVASSSVTGLLTSTADEGTNAFEVQEGETETFTLRVTVTNSAGAEIDGDQFRAVLTGINFADSDSATGDSVFTSNLQSVFRTDFARIAN